MEHKWNEGDRCLVIGGTHKGKAGAVQDINVSNGGNVTCTVLQDNGVRFKTLLRNCSPA